MKSLKSAGFTLIEALVVVLIISVITVLVYPTYKHMVAQSRFSTLMPVVRTVSNAQEAYYLRNGRYATNREALTVNYPPDAEKMTFALGGDEDFSFILASHNQVPNAYYVMYQKLSKNFPSNIHCEAKKTDEDAVWLCEEGLAGEKLEHGSLLGEDYTTFILQGNPEDGRFIRNYTGDSNVSLTNGDSCQTNNGSGCDNVEATGSSTCTVENGGTGCNNSSFSGDSTCTSGTGSGVGCKDSNFSDNSICNSQSASSCSHSNFSSSSCYASGGANSCGDGSVFTNHSTCYGKSSAQNRPTTACGNSTYIDSTCYNTANQGYVCGSSTYSNSSCYGNYYGGCGGNSTYTNGSHCYGDGATACNKSTYTSGSVCHANAKGACSNSTFREGAYCTGEYCPSGSPKQDGTTWQPCPNAGNSGKTC